MTFLDHSDGRREAPGFWQRIRRQWRAYMSHVDPRYESLYFECQRIIQEHPELKLRSIFFGVYEENPGGAFTDDRGRRYHYRHLAVAVKWLWEERAALLMTGRRHLTDIEGDLPGSMAYDCFMKSGPAAVPGYDGYLAIRNPDELNAYVERSLDLRGYTPSRRRIFRDAAYVLCGRSYERLAALLRRLNRARAFYTVEIRDTDPFQELGRSLGRSELIGLMMFVSTRTDIERREMDAVTQPLRRLFYDAHLMRSRAREALRVSDDIFLNLTKLLPLPQLVHDGRRILYMNPRGLEFFGVKTVDEMNAARSVLEYVHPAYRARVQVRMRSLLNDAVGRILPLREEQFLRMDGTALDVEVAAAKVNWFGRDAVQVVFTDIGERKRVEEERERSRLYDSLTGLANRSLFLDRLDQALARTARRAELASLDGAVSARNEGGLIATLYIDIDNFREINDLFRFAAGDELLKAIAHRMQQFVPRAFTLSRLSGDKFGVFLPGIHDTTQAVFFAEGLQDLFRLKPFEVGGDEIPVTFSAGLAFYPMDGRSAGELLSHAEIALARAKLHKNHVQLFNAEMNRRTARLFETEKALIRAMGRGEDEQDYPDGRFVVYYQPQIDIENRCVRGVEALIRWQHPVKGLIPPVEFITLAEERGLILEIGEWVLEEACGRLQAAVENECPPVELSVNVTPRQLVHPDFSAMVQRIVRRTGFDPRRLKLEIVERGIVGDDESASVLKVMQELTEAGIRFHVDDFGVGGAALTYVRRFPIDTIKIDRSFVENIDENERIVRGLVAFAENLGFDVIVEGVESEEQLEFFRSLGCRDHQGYLFAKPMAAEDCEKFVLGFA